MKIFYDDHDKSWFYRLGDHDSGWSAEIGGFLSYAECLLAYQIETGRQ